VNAINAVADKNLLKESTIYVNLEPCAHHGKTPPCADLIVAMGIPRVVIGCTDSFSEVSGRGVARMREAGCEVTIGVLEAKSRWLNRRFFTFHERKRPYVILKWAQTRDGFIDALRKVNNPNASWITNEISRSLVHKWRTEEQAIMVGSHTAKLDNPRLNVRAWHGTPPMRITIDKELSMPESLALFDGSQPTVVYTAVEKEACANLEFVTIDFAQDIIPQILSDLYQRHILSVVVEGGEILLRSFIQASIWDEAYVFRGEKFFVEGTPAPELCAQPTERIQLHETSLYYYQNPHTTANV
jgi:diaminohydroxyphosphoribosylaminopyrimidine deaminase/5-amino-6-(5-phosphoribosylamino)uracil reductase